MRKKIFVAALALLSAAGAAAELPVLVGHRGSQYGVENTVESFRNGADLGYQYLETDFKVTKDGKFVCTHDDDISRLSGSTLTIAGSTLDELQAVPFKQTRGGVAYTGRLCSGQEYLDVCKEKGVRPLIELKWATGINSNDCSGIPALIRFIEDNGFRNSCIILTSMKPCLEYIRKNYPDITLQFLTGQYWANHFDWCVEQGIDVDIQTGYFDKATVEKFHDAGLKVNMWTTNTADGYTQYGNWGCDYITTDYLDGHNLPELDPAATFPPNTTDYPRLEAPVRGSYTPAKVAEHPSAPLASVKRAVMNDNVWYVLGTDASGSQKLVSQDAFSGKTAELSIKGIDAPLGDIAMTADGQILATVPFDHAGADLRIFRWATAASSPELLVEVPGLRVGAGHVFTATGRATDLWLYTADGTNSITGLNLKSNTLVHNTADCGTNWVISPNSRKNIIMEKDGAVTEVTFDWEGAACIPYAAGINGVPSFHRRASKVYALAPERDADGFSARLQDFSKGFDGLRAISPRLHEGLKTDAGEYVTTSFSHGADGTFLHLFTAGHGIAAYRLMDETSAAPADADFVLTREWIMSNTTGNHPGNIDGTNAQQGTAVNGVFYINNCAEKNIHLFDKTGHIGTLPGGAGWGCARDDAGNVIVRDDKLTGDTHSFIIYPAGSRDAAEAVRLEVKVPLAGQCNFINAGGDVLGATGHIYLFPNGQPGANIIAMENGKVAYTDASADLKVHGSTAGYIIPVDDDTENWIYQVRTSGLYLYSGGVNTDLHTARASTAAPGRNSTGGGAYFMLRGHKILVHNSGSNYKGGFTVRNLTRDNVIANIDPIGTLGYETGGNYSTFNWLIPEQVDDNTVRLYQYCPSNGIAVYTLTDKNAGVSPIRTETEGDTIDITQPYEAYNLTGQRIGARPLPPGVYILCQGAKTGKYAVGKH